MSMHVVKKNAGFTLVETLVVLGIVTIIATAIGVFQSGVFKNERIARTRILAMEDARLALRRFTEEARNISPSSTGAYPILTADTHAFTFYADIDNDNLKERFRYYVDNGFIKKAVLKPTGSPPVYSGSEKVTIVARFAVASPQPIFTYYDTNDTVLLHPLSVADVRSVKMYIATEVLSSNAVSTTTVNMETRATLRNLKDNY